MARLEWDKASERLYETGVRNCALYAWGKVIDTEESYDLVETEPADFSTATDKYYKKTVDNEYVLKEAGDTWEANTYYTHTAEESHEGYTAGVAWNGITAINETPTGAEATDLYADDMKYLSLLSAEELEGTIEAYMYPDEWEQCDGSATTDGVTFGQQSRKQFCLAYVTTVGNDTDSNDYGEKLHLLYNGKASPSERAYATINDSPEAITFSWSLKATKEKISDALKKAMEAKGVYLKDTALITISKRDKHGNKTPYYDTIYDAVFGTDPGDGVEGTDPKMLMPNDICNIILGTNTNG